VTYSGAIIEPKKRKGHRREGGGKPVRVVLEHRGRSYSRLKEKTGGAKIGPAAFAGPPGSDRAVSKKRGREKEVEYSV